MSEVKYITYEGRAGVSQFVIFDPNTSHEDMASNLSIERDRLIGAGFIRLETRIGPHNPFGFSNTLKLGVSTRCAAIFNRHIVR